ncbi:MAG: hypothetical protein VX777_08210 [Chlamydiota bacterium]|nr:hypothetical protein [Chlamydiota bacterium]
MISDCLNKEVESVINHNNEIIHSTRASVYDTIGSDKMSQILNAGYIDSSTFSELKDRKYNILQANYHPYSERRDRYQHYFFHFNIKSDLTATMTLDIGMIHTGHAEHPAFYAKMKAQGKHSNGFLEDFDLIREATQIIFLEKRDSQGNEYTDEAIIGRLNKTMHAKKILKTRYCCEFIEKGSIKALSSEKISVTTMEGLGFIRMLFLGADNDDYLEENKENRSKLFLSYLMDL